MAILSINDQFRCNRCKHAADLYGRGCDINSMYPVMLIIHGRKDCPDFKFDINKIQQELEATANRETANQ